MSAESRTLARESPIRPMYFEARITRISYTLGRSCDPLAKICLQGSCFGHHDVAYIKFQNDRRKVMTDFPFRPRHLQTGRSQMMITVWVSLIHFLIKTENSFQTVFLMNPIRMKPRTTSSVKIMRKIIQKSKRNRKRIGWSFFSSSVSSDSSDERSEWRNFVVSDGKPEEG